MQTDSGLTINDQGLGLDGSYDSFVFYDTGKGIIVVDPGSNFIDYYIQVKPYLNKHGKKIVATLVSHGHYDHWSRLGQVREGLIFIPPLVFKLIRWYALTRKDRLLNESLLRTMPLIADYPVLVNEVPVRIDVFSLFHSIPQTMGFVLKSKRARVVHLGEFSFNGMTSFDKTVLIRKLYDISREPVDYLVMTIFNADEQGFSLPEDIVLDNLTEIIRKSPGRTIITCFATNLMRIKQMVYRAKKLYKLVGFEGLAMNFAQGLIGFRDTKESYYKDVVFVSGCQGEEDSFLGHILSSNNSFYLNSEDTLVFSSRCVNGNEKRLRRLFDRLQELVGNLIVHEGEVKRLGLDNINIEESIIHVSGYERLEGLKLVLEILRPKKVLCWPQVSPQIDYFRDVCERLGIEIINELERIIQI